MGRLNARQARKKILAITGLFAMGAMLMLPIFTALPALAGGGGGACLLYTSDAADE